MEASYIESYRGGKLGEKLERAKLSMQKCTLCPRLCGVDRLSGETGYCKTARDAVIASYGPHFGEERPLVGRNGSGTIFFSNCNLSCVFCQNFEISHGGEGVRTDAGGLAGVMLDLQKKGCHNINFVTPSHVIFSILEALPVAIERGLHVPLVFNSGGYERVSALKLLEGIVDIYMPDFKFWDSAAGADFCDAPDYPERARSALKEMHRQVGDLVLDENGVARRGLLVRHLVMPNNVSGTEEVVGFLANDISRNTYLNMMDQYHPCGDAFKNRAINRRITPEEFRSALESARKAGLTRLDDRHRHWLQIEL
ncbi:MAG: radical SAM protein [Syntrophobacteraceae bacterium]